MDKAIVQVSNLSKSYKGLFASRKLVVDNLCFEILQGQTVGFLGPNGAGKSTTLLMLLGLVLPSSGSINLFNLGNNLHSARREIGFCPDNFTVNQTLTPTAVLKAYAMLSGLSGSELRRKVAFMLDRVGLKEAAGQRVATFSKGMLQRLGLAQALIHEPQLLILDELTSGLDHEGRKFILDFIDERKQHGNTTFFSSHVLSDIQKVCDHVLVLRKGRLVFKGAIPENLEEVYLTAT